MTADKSPDLAPLRERLADIIEDFRSHQNDDELVEAILAEVRNLESLRANPSLDDIPTPHIAKVLLAITGDER